MSLGPLVGLIRFSFTVMLETAQSPEERVADLESWCHLLLTSPPSIKEIDVTFDCFFLTEEVVESLFPSSTSLGIADTSTWLETLDKTLANDSVFPCLECVKVKILLPDEYGYLTDSEYSYSDTELSTPQDVARSVRKMMEQTRRLMYKKRPRGVVDINVQVGHQLDWLDK